MTQGPAMRHGGPQNGADVVTKIGELRYGEVRRIYLLGTRVNSDVHRAPCTRIRSWLSASCNAGDCVSVLVAMLSSYLHLC